MAIQLKGNVSVDVKKINDVIAGVNYISRPPLAKKAFALSKVKKRILDFLIGIFPVSNRPRRVHLVSGFRAYEFERGNNVGMTIQHRGIKDLRIREILFSLEEGSRGYYQRPETVNEHGYGIFTIKPGAGISRSKVPGIDFAMRKRIHIPSRAGRHFMLKTAQFAQNLINEAKPEFFKKAKEAMRNPSSRTEE